jgi:hypothetical protein
MIVALCILYDGDVDEGCVVLDMKHTFEAAADYMDVTEGESSSQWLPTERVVDSRYSSDTRTIIKKI